MKKKINKIITIIAILIYMIPFFFVEKKVSANQVEVTDEYILGALINASQGGRSRGGSALMGRAGGHLIGGQRGVNSRFIEKGLKRGPDTDTGPGGGGGGGSRSTAFKPSTIDIGQAYNDYRNFILEGDFSNNVYVVPVNKLYSASPNTLENSELTNGVTINKGTYTGSKNWVMPRHDVVNLPIDFRYMYVETSNVSINDSNAFEFREWRSNSGTYERWDYDQYFYNEDFTDDFLRLNISRARLANLRVRAYTGGNSSSFYLHNLYFSDYADFAPNHVEIIHNEINMITKQEFINNYTNYFNLEYDNSTNQLVENDKYFVYNTNDFSDNSVTIDNHYITNNYTTIIESGSDSDVTEQLNYTSLFERMISAIKDLPQQIRDKFDDFSGGGGGPEPEPVEEGKGFWKSLFDAIAELARSFGAFITSIPELLLNLLDGLLGLVEQVVGLFIPTAEQMEELKTAFSGLTDDISLKFSPLTDSIESINTVFSSPKSIYSLTYEFEGETINVIPIQLQGQINNFKTLLNGVLVLSTFISIYKRFVGREDVIK